MRSLTITSPAKLNLYLKVIRRRRDGYHDLVTLFHRISLQDTLRLTKAPKFSLTCTKRDLSCGPDNLISRAYELLQKKFPHLGGVRVRLIKRIPVGGGLGGGSSNAAFFLLGMKKLFGLKISQKQLAALGKRLGADIPFFVHNVNQAIGKGRGDVIIPRPAKHRMWFLLLISDKGVSTKKVYQTLPRPLGGASLTKVTLAVTILCDFLDRKKKVLSEKFLQNDLEQSAFKLRPSIARSIRKLNALGFQGARMSGSGPTVFVILSHQKEARQVFRKLRRDGWTGKMMVCHSL